MENLKKKNIDDNHFIACVEKLGLRSGNDEYRAARKIDAESGRMIEQQEMGGEQCSADKCSFDSWRKRVPAEPVKLHRQPDPQGGSQTKREAARQAAQRVNFEEIANIPLPGRQASEDEVKSSAQMLVRR